MSAHRPLALAVLAAALLGACAPQPRSADGYIDDAAITARVKAALLRAPAVRADAIAVETVRGVVSLSGSVDSREAAAQAVRAAEQVSGVRSVKNDMRLKPAS